MKKRAKQIEAYGKASNRVRKATMEIEQALRNRETPNGVTWADAEEVAYLAKELERIADRMLSRGEYAPTARCPECGDDSWTPGTVCEFCAAHGFEHEAM